MAVDISIGDKVRWHDHNRVEHVGTVTAVMQNGVLNVKDAIGRSQFVSSNVVENIRRGGEPKRAK